MNKIESSAVLPRGAQRLSEYERFYSWKDEADKRTTVMAIYIVGGINVKSGNELTRHWVSSSDFPIFLDGGCGILYLEFDVVEQKIIRIDCNGDA